MLMTVTFLRLNPVSLFFRQRSLGPALFGRKPKVCHFLANSLHLHSTRGFGWSAHQASIKPNEVGYVAKVYLAAAEMLSYDQLMRSCDTNSSRIHQSELS
jgi:hypothetical protein